MIYYICQSVARAQNDYDKFENFAIENDDCPEEVIYGERGLDNDFGIGSIGGLFGKRGEEVTVKDLANKASLGSLM